jgi:hypothetical protein
MPFPYYRRLSAEDKEVYRRSAAIAKVPLGDAASLGPAVRAIEASLAKDDRAAVEAACGRLVHGIARKLGVEPLSVIVLATRPSNAAGELHGLYVREPGRRAVIRVWMRTAAREDVVRFRTFLRTLLHEVCHHLDYVHFKLPDSFHTEGFFQRESSLMRQLAPRGRRRGPAPEAPSRSEPPKEPGYDAAYARRIIEELERIPSPAARPESPAPAPAPLNDGGSARNPKEHRRCQMGFPFV